MAREREQLTDDDKDRKFGGRGGNAGAAFRGRKPRRDPNFVPDYKNPAQLKAFITDRGKLTPARVNGNSAKQQRALAVAVRRARMIALLPFSVTGQ